MAHALGYLRLLALAFAWAGAWPLATMGQTAAPGQPVRFTVFAAKPIAGLAFAPWPNATPEKLVFQPTARSARHEYRGPMPLRFVDAATGAVVAEAHIPPTIRDALLLFSPLDPTAAGTGKAGASTLRYQIAVLDDAAARHAPGGLAILNLSGLTLAGTVNNERVTLKAGLNPTLAAGRTAKVALSTVFKNRTYQSYAGTVSLGRNERALLILFPPYYQGSLEVQSRVLIDQPPGTSAPASAAPKAPAPPR